LFEDFLDVLSGDVFEEIPVTVEEFVTSRDFVRPGAPAFPSLSVDQMRMLKAMTQILGRDTLIQVWGEGIGKSRWEETFNEIILQLGKGCHAPYTPVFDPSTGKWSRLDSFVGDGLVASSDGANHYATESFREGFGQMVRVKTSLGLSEDVYVGHKYLSLSRSDFYHRYRGIDPSFVSVDNLFVGDRIAVAAGFDVSSPTYMQPEVAELIGFWLGDGMLPTDANPIINMDFCSDESESIARYEELCLIIGDSPTKTIHPNKSLTFFRHGRNSKAVQIAKDNGLWGMRSHTKLVPDCVLSSDNKTIALVVEKLWQTDGCVYAKNGLTAEYVSVSEQLATDVQRMLLRLGVPSALRSRTPKSNFANASLAWYVTVSSQECVGAFFDKIKLLDHKRPELTEKTGRTYKRLQDNYYYDRIASIEPIGDGEFWTKTVPDTGNYVGNGMISANSGKDFISTVAVAYIVYVLLCMKDPASYYGKPQGDAIDILNIAINATQAKNVFFKGFKQRIDNNPWFDGKYDAKADNIEFDKHITVHSGHSERESWEGYNLLVVILDEISGFALESASGNLNAKTSEQIYDMYSASVVSRFPDYGKTILLSFPRYKDDFIQQRYAAVVASKNTVIHTERLIVNPDLPDDYEGNFVEFEWEEDHIISYREPRVFALKRPSWIINPTKKVTDYTGQFFKNMTDALMRFACMPPESIDGMFKDSERVNNAFRQPLAIEEDGTINHTLVADPEKIYYIHVDLAQKIDRCAVSMAHVDSWTAVRYKGISDKVEPVVVVDFIRYWTPSASKTVDFAEVRDFIVSMSKKGFNIGLVTFDRWNSVEMMEYLDGMGLKTDRLSVAKPHYTDLLMVVNEGRCHGPDIELVRKELKQLRIIKDKVDHPRSGSKDLADATCGAVFNAISLTPKDNWGEVEIQTYDSLRASRPVAVEPPEAQRATGPIPDELAAYLDGITVL
jgi:intein/homing endonuclease